MKIEFQGISYSYIEDVVIDKLSCVIKDKGVTCLCGKNGAGKTTLMNILLKINTNYEGNVLIDKIDIKEMRRCDILSEIAFCNQEQWLYYDTPLNNILMGKSMDAVISKYIDYFNLSEIFEQNCENEIIGDNYNLSGGQKQLLIIVRTLAKGKETMIFDEPTSHLDEINTRKFYELINEHDGPSDAFDNLNT